MPPRSWFQIREACEKCGVRFERDEQEDHWLGAYLLNFIVTPIVFYLFSKAMWLAIDRVFRPVRPEDLG